MCDGISKVYPGYGDGSMVVGRDGAREGFGYAVGGGGTEDYGRVEESDILEPGGVVRRGVRDSEGGGRSGLTRDRFWSSPIRSWMGISLAMGYARGALWVVFSIFLMPSVQSLSGYQLRMVRA